MKTSELILEYIKALVWPLIALYVLILFHEPIGELLKRTKKLALPGGITVETFSEDLEETKILSETVSEEIIEESKTKGNLISSTEANSRMMELGLSPSPSGLQLSYYESLANQNPNLALIALRLEVDAMLKNLANGSNVSVNFDDSSEIIATKLKANNALTSQQYDFIVKTLRLCDKANYGLEVSKAEVDDILVIAAVLRDAYVAWLSWGFPNN